MYIAGLQKLTLLDFPGQVACTLFTPGCNFKCPFCHNAALVTEQAPDCMEVEEFFRFLETRQGILDGVCVTGGEPTLQPDLPEFLERIKSLSYVVKLDTNGYKPQVLRKVAETGLVDYVAMDIKNTPEKYGITTGLSSVDTDAIFESVDFLKNGTVPFEFRTTVVKEFHDPEDLITIARWLSGDMPYFLQEFKDSGGLICGGLTGWEQADLRAIVEKMKPFLPRVSLRES